MDGQLTIANAISSMLHAVDGLRWPEVRAAFANTVRVDYTSLAGGKPLTMPAEHLIASWKELLPGFEATQHLTGPVVTDIVGQSAIAETHVRAYHRINGAAGGNVWIVAGHYSFGLVPSADRWLINAIKLTVFYQEGNLRLPEIARERAKHQGRAAS